MPPHHQPCLRWRERDHVMRAAPEPFDPDRYLVTLEAGDAIAKGFITRHHYSGTYPAARLRFLLHQVLGRGEPAVVGAAVLGVPMQERVLTMSFPSLEPYAESLELARFVLLDRVSANAESWFLARCFRLAAGEGIRGVVSFSDPVPRTRADGSVVMPGHVGIIYQASNGIFDARRSSARTLLIGPDGRAFSPRALQKIRRGEQGHAYAERQLIEWGASERRARQSRSAWLEQALEDAGIRRVRHPGNYRYLFRLGDRRQRARVRVVFDGAPYPKPG